MAPGEIGYYAQTMPGVEEIAWLEIRSRLPRAAFGEYLFAKEKNGIICFGYAGEIPDVLALRTTEDLFLHALSMPKLSRDWRDLRLIAEGIRSSAEFGRAVATLLNFRKIKGAPSYRVVTRQVGKHQYRRKDLEEAVFKGMKTRYPHWRPVSENVNVEVWANLIGSRLLVGLRLSDRSMRHRYKKAVELEASLRPSVAAALIHLTQPQPGDVFVDPMCGSGTLLLERQYAGAYGYILGGDITGERARAARQNLAAQRKDIYQKAIAVCQWDGLRLPFADRAIDKVATNLPFGKRIGSNEAIRSLYPAFFAELERVLRMGGRAVVLSSEFDLVKKSVRQCDGLGILTGYSIAVLGQWGRIYIVEHKA
jgi:23S rRNA G2445 N2-methylase RlmL